MLGWHAKAAWEWRWLKLCKTCGKTGICWFFRYGTTVLFSGLFSRAYGFRMEIQLDGPWDGIDRVPCGLTHISWISNCILELHLTCFSWSFSVVACVLSHWWMLKMRDTVKAFVSITKNGPPKISRQPSAEIRLLIALWKTQLCLKKNSIHIERAIISMTTLPRIPVICLPLRRALRLGDMLKTVCSFRLKLCTPSKN